MWNLISHFLTFAGGMASGVMLIHMMSSNIAGTILVIEDGKIVE